MAKLYDPRIGEYVESNNPALILLHIIDNKFRADELSEDIIPRIIELANYCDEKVPVIKKRHLTKRTQKIIGWCIVIFSIWIVWFINH